MDDFWNARFAAADMMSYSGVDVGLVIYLCLEKLSLTLLVYVFPPLIVARRDSVMVKFHGHRP